MWGSLRRPPPVASDPNRPTLPADLVQWSENSVTVEQLIEDYDLPQIIEVTIGWCGVDESSPDSLQGEEVVLFHEYITQNRIVAEDRFGQHLSISKDFAYKFEVVTDQDKARTRKEPPPEPLSIPELLERHEVPVKVRLATRGGSYIQVTQPKFYHEVKDFGEVTLIRPHSVNYLVGHCLLREDLNQYCAIAVLPLPLEIEVAVGEISTKGGNKEWVKFVRKLSKMARETFDFGEFIKLQHDIYLLKAGEVPPEENEYDMIKPKLVQGAATSSGGSTTRNMIETSYADYRGLLGGGSKGAAAGNIGRAAPLPLPPSYTEFSKQPPAMAKSPVEKEAGSRLQESRDFLYGCVEGRPQGPALPPRKVDPSSPPPRPPKPGTSTVPTNGVSKKKPVEFPDDLSKLSIDEVCDVLEELNLGTYTPQFRRDDIDGDMLCSVSKQMLIEDIGMSRFHALKLEKFIKGWRPNKVN